MMTALTDSRKRSREEDGSDFMPLSKRITNLHINTSSSPMQSDNDITDYNMNLNQQQQQQQQQLHHHQAIQQHQQQQYQNQNQFIGPFGHSNGESNQFSEYSNLTHPIDVQERQYQQYLIECNNASSSNGSSCTNISSNENGNPNQMGTYDPYEPELSQEENPFYYTKNKLLYDLYLERVRRHQ